MESGNEFQTVGAANVKDRLPFADFMNGTLASFYPKNDEMTGEEV